MQNRPISRTWQAATLLFFSGASALIYQTVWMRDFRLIFGASTVATGAVLAIFMFGLGAGSALLGKRADRHPWPLAFYGQLEMLIALSAALTPLLLMATRWIYFAVGGSAVLGTVMATVVRLILSTLVLGIPTVLMGGTLPAMARAVESQDDQGRRRLALLYGVNTMGAVIGALVSTFFMLERFGNRRTLLIAAVINLALGAFAYTLGRGATKQEQAASEEGTREAAMPPRLILLAAAVVGFAFLLMELVWYRMLSPILGGTTFMFGLVLAIALAGIGLGGAIYASGDRERSATAGGFAVTCTLEALAMIFPYALGDRLALLANALRSLRVFGFSGHITSWTMITTIAVLPAAIVAGYQFPLLISLLGRGRDHVGREVGMTYAWNTGGSILASLLGSFILIPAMGARGSWKLAVGVLVALGVLVFFYALREKNRVFAGAAATSALLAVFLMFSIGPTAVWRHAGIGAGRAPAPTAPNALRQWLNSTRQSVLFERDGRESSIALLGGDDLGLIVNGKSDGSARGDAGTQVMAGMLAALVHPDAKTAMVVGLGTGTTSGWLADIPSIERVDVVELEPVVVEIASYFAAVNRNAVDNPKHHLSIGDAREVLLTTRQKYDVVFSEPSNPYRAGIASLYTRDFYTVARQRLKPKGIFVQWVQTYDIDTRTMETIYATISSVFPNVDTFTTTPGDIILMASAEPIVYDTDLIRKRLAVEPYRSAAHVAWRAETPEGILARFIASEKFAQHAAQGIDTLNTDDRQVIEFSFARSLGREQDIINQIRLTAQRIGADKPTMLRGAVDWSAVEQDRLSIEWMQSTSPKTEFAKRYDRRDYKGALASWREAPWQPANTLDNARLGHVLADAGDDAALAYIDPLRPWEPEEADALTGLLLFRKGSLPGAATLLGGALERYRQNPWPLPEVMDMAVTTLPQTGRDPNAAPKVMDPLAQPYASYVLEEPRALAFLVAAWETKKCSPTTLAALREFEPNVPWKASVLEMRSVCYAAAGLPELAARAQREQRQYIENEGVPIAQR